MIHDDDGTDAGTRISDFIVEHILVFPMLQFYFLSSIGFLFLSSVLNKNDQLRWSPAPCALAPHRCIHAVFRLQPYPILQSPCSNH